MLQLHKFKGDGLSVQRIGERIKMSKSHVHYSIQRLISGGVVSPDSKVTYPRAVKEVLLFGVKYFFPAKIGAQIRGMPTAHSAFKDVFKGTALDEYVWPYAEGTFRGQSLTPLHQCAIQASIGDVDMYRVLSALDMIRIGRPREVEMARTKIEEFINGYATEL
jgi:hypothetical protein